MARPKKFNEVDAVAAARRQFNETGYHGTSVDDLSRATGLSKGSLYSAFGDKESLFQRVLDEYCASSAESAVDLLAGPDDEALDRIRAWLRWPDGCSDRRGCLLAKATAELAWENDAVATRSRPTKLSSTPSRHWSSKPSEPGTLTRRRTPGPCWTCRHDPARPRSAVQGRH